MNKPQVILKEIDCDDSLKQIIIDGAKLLNDTWAADEYYNEFMAFEFVQTNGKTNQQIWDELCANPLELSVKLWDMGWKRNHIWHTIGYEDESTPGWVYINSYFVGTPYQVANNLGHECFHVLGYSHINPTDYTSVPYGNNTIFENTLAKLNPSIDTGE